MNLTLFYTIRTLFQRNISSIEKNVNFDGAFHRNASWKINILQIKNIVNDRNTNRSYGTWLNDISILKTKCSSGTKETGNNLDSIEKNIRLKNSSIRSMEQERREIIFVWFRYLINIILFKINIKIKFHFTNFIFF